MSKLGKKPRSSKTSNEYEAYRPKLPPKNGKNKSDEAKALAQKKEQTNSQANKTSVSKTTSSVLTRPSSLARGDSAYRKPALPPKKYQQKKPKEEETPPPLPKKTGKRDK